MDDVINFFAYNELMDQRNMRERGLEFVSCSPVTLSAYKLVFNKIPLDNSGIENLGLANLVLTPNNLGMVTGVLYEMSKGLLPKLDEIHGYPQEYNRKIHKLFRHDFNPTQGYVYMAQPGKMDDNLKPTKAMLKKYKGARKELGLLNLSRIMTTPTVD
ncbi:MAG: gamma-glutamylcyclotransferase family protein [Nitrospinota bacterium]|nr:gamma-glutamylcyclotransferase family protein [Nitrospinota bacterium]